MLTKHRYVSAPLLSVFENHAMKTYPPFETNQKNFSDLPDISLRVPFCLLPCLSLLTRYLLQHQHPLQGNTKK
jgi:hypothetical protein